MKCQTQAKPQEYSDQSSQSERQSHLVRMGRRVAGPGQGKKYSNYCKWKDAHPDKYNEMKHKTKVWKKNTILNAPWLKHYASAKKRCSDKSHWYYKNGIECSISIDEVKFAWFRDQAEHMSSPVIDRINSTLGYVSGNVQFIERKENQKKMIFENKQYGWSKKHESCVNCKTTTIRHYGKGLCKSCYQRSWIVKRNAQCQLLSRK